MKNKGGEMLMPRGLIFSFNRKNCSRSHCKYPFGIKLIRKNKDIYLRFSREEAVRIRDFLNRCL